MKSNLKSFEIKKLFYSKNVKINFNNPTKILIGENGIGKTTILYIIYNSLIGDFSKLKKIDFEKIIINFENNEKITIDKEDIMFLNEKYTRYRNHGHSIIHHRQSHLHDKIIQNTEENLSKTERKELISAFKTKDKEKSRKKCYDLVKKIHKHERYPFELIFNTLRSYYGNNIDLTEIKTKIKDNLKEEIIYLPTYRRIEEDIDILGIETEDEDLNNNLIQFGMDDVSEMINSILERIKTSSVVGFSKITGEILTEYVSDIKKIDNTFKKKLTPEVVDIVLSRVGDNIKNNDKKRIIKLIKTEEIFSDDNKNRYLINFLIKLVQIHEKQKDYDEKLKKFSEVCNSYLVNKKIIYDESNITISIKDKYTKEGKEVELKDLSSGEKQIISLFAKVFLKHDNNLIILFDEPELSLSIEWQKQILPDIMNSKKCNQLLVFTHSPFIFDNKFDKFAEELTINKL